MALSPIDWTTYTDLTPVDVDLIQQVTEFTQQHFRSPRFDASHDFNHVKRVLANSLHIAEAENEKRTAQALPRLDLTLVILGALLHDVEDRKYVDLTKQIDMPLAVQELLRLGVDLERAQTIQDLVNGVSYKAEKNDPDALERLIRRIPELAVVQDADRLDAIGAIGIGRCFTYGGAKTSRDLAGSITHFRDKLVKLESLMKTQRGRELARKRTQRVVDFMGWWDDEITFDPGSDGVSKS